MQNPTPRRAPRTAPGPSRTDRRKTEFLATLAHELRNPLAPLRTGLDLAGSIEDVQPELARLHSMMARQVVQLTRLVDDLLDLTRVSQDRVELRHERVPLSDVLDGAVEACRPLVDQCRHALVVDAPDAHRRVDVDPVRLTQVLTNLLTNAARYTPPGGRIRLEASLDERGLRVAVEDDGEGLAAEDLEAVFEMFTQIRGETPREHGGLGIGLTLSRRIVELHGGRLTAGSPGRGLGSRFEVHLPQPAEPPGLDAGPEAGSQAGSQADPASDPVAGPVAGSGAEAARPADPSIAPPTRVLVVDDNRDAADTLARVLRLRGHDVDVVYSGHAALEAVDGARPDVVFLDIGLPDITGYRVASELGERDYRAGMVLVALTGWGMAKDRERGRDAGFQHHLTKPVSASTVLELLATIASARRG